MSGDYRPDPHAQAHVGCIGLLLIAFTLVMGAWALMAFRGTI